MKCLITIVLWIWAFSKVSSAIELVAVPELTLNFMNSQKSEKLLSGQSFKGDVNEPLWITSVGRSPILILPVKPSNGSLKIDPPVEPQPPKIRCESTVSVV